MTINDAEAFYMAMNCEQVERVFLTFKEIGPAFSNVREAFCEAIRMEVDRVDTSTFTLEANDNVRS